MDRLRSPNGCPWDREQTYATLAPMLLEEAYEAFEAVEDAREGRPRELCDELGDLLFQIVFYSQVAKERGEFTIDDVTTAIHDKMVRRHPHVFGDVTANDAATVLLNWETMKAEERRASGKTEHANTSLLVGVSSKAPALMEAHQLSTKAARVGFDWPEIEGVLDKVREEIEEIKAAETDFELASEIGDLFFALVNVARWKHVDAESALRGTNMKFKKRLGHVERGAKKQARNLSELSLDEMESLWQEAKKSE